MTLNHSRWLRALGAALLLSALGCNDEGGVDPTRTPEPLEESPGVDPTPTPADTPTPEPSPTPTAVVGESPTATETAPEATPTQTVQETPTATSATPTPEPTPPRVDEDGDGYSVEEGDCDDTRADVSPADPEVPYDGLDNDCQGGDLTDVDQDGSDGGPGGEDCDDQDPDRAPDLEEIPYDDIDNDCDGSDLTDVDGDGRDGIPAGGTDCDDSDAGTYPGATEIPYDDIDQDCSGADLTDVDGDTFDATEAGGDDCDDGNVNTHPGAAEFEDGQDNDCDGEIDESSSAEDGDGDGFSPATGDCDDDDSAIYPGATETPYDGIDQDCSGSDLSDVDGDGFAGGPRGADCDDLNDAINPGVTEIPYNGVDDDCQSGDLVDVDGDGYGATLVGGPDCADEDAAVHPDAQEHCDDEDEDCDGRVDESPLDGVPFYQDLDGDGFGNPSKPTTACAIPDGYVADMNDCKDNNDLVFPGATEYCNGVDDDCDTVIDDGVSTPYFLDSDGDGYGDPSQSIQACGPQSGYVQSAGDCDDGDDTVNPDGVEACDGVDDDCDALTDEGVIVTYHQDLDSDGYGNPAAPLESCAPQAGYVLDATDCKDTNDNIHPGATEFCNGVDDDCDGALDDDATQTYFPDEDGDGFGDSSAPVQACSPPPDHVLSGGDCDDTRALVSPVGVEQCNGLDDNCSGAVDEGVQTTFYTDSDGDGFGDASSPVQACALESGYVTDQTDCDDDAASTHPGADEVCNGGDDDCDAEADEGIQATFYSDGDSDGYGNPNAATQACSAPSGYVGTGTDCNDSVASINPGAVEACNSVDDNCNTVIDDLDADGDGHRPTACGGDDCDDSVATTHPGAVDVCDDGVDNDCSGRENYCYDSASFDGAKFN